MEIQRHFEIPEVAWYAEFLMGRVQEPDNDLHWKRMHLEECQGCREQVMEMVDISKSIQGLMDINRQLVEQVHRPRLGFWYRMIYHVQRLRAKAGLWSF